MRRQAALWFVVVVSIAGFVWLSGPPPPATAAERTVQVKQPELLGQIVRYRRTTWHWQRVMGAGLTRSSASARRVSNFAYRRWVRDLWRRRATKARRRAHNPPHEAGWLCIHRYERHPAMGWRTQTGNGFYGGLQMDWTFMATYGARLLRLKGTADRWTPLEQMWVAERALRAGRGFHPWPNSARACGLI
jgi:hypothetical protein